MTRILLIEDDADTRRLIAAALEFEGFAVTRAEDGPADIAAVRKETPDLILCDIMMPGMDGYQVLATLHADTELAAIPFIFLTANAETALIRSSSEATIKKHLEHIFEKLGVEKRGAASHIALEALVA